MTQHKLVEANIPLYFRCLSVPVEWRRAIKQRPNVISLSSLGTPQPPEDEEDGDLLEAKRVFGKNATTGDNDAKAIEFFRATTFDAWEKRNEFFRLQEGDTKALLKFLRSVGLFERPYLGGESSRVKKTLLSTQDGQVYDSPYESTISEKYIWGIRRLIEKSLHTPAQRSGGHHDFQVRIERTKDGKSQLVLTTTTFLDALVLTLSVDQVQGAKVRKCARPDCGVSFSSTGGHKRKYCTWYCGHIESVRRNRRQARKRKGVAHGKQR